MLKHLRYFLWQQFAFLLPYSIFIRIMFRQKVGYWPDLDHPKTFCEKIQVLKIDSKKHPEYTNMVDKAEAKHFVASIVGDKYIIPTYGVWSKFDDIDFHSLPDGYILKCTHDSSKGIVVRDRSSLDRVALKKRMEYYLKRNYYDQNREFPYKNVPHRIIAEKFLVNSTDAELKDYKFFCFNGKAEYCQIISNRSTDETIDFFDRDWKLQEFIGLNPHVHHANEPHLKPHNYDEMLWVADTLSKAIASPFVRIDLYNVNGKVYFGEITFFPAGGMGRFSPTIYDRKLGDMLSL